MSPRSASPKRARLPGVGQRVHLARQAAGKSLQQLGAMVNAESSTLWRIEQGSQEPGAALLLAIADATDHPVEWLMRGAHSREGSVPLWWEAFCAAHYDATAHELEVMRAIATALPENLRAKRVFMDTALALLRSSLQADDFRETVDLNAALSRSED